MISCYAALSHFLEPRAWTIYLSIAVVVQGHWYMYIYANPMLYECYMRHEKCLTGNHHPIDHSMISTYTPVILRGKALSGTRSLNYAPQKWHSGPRTMVDIYIYAIPLVYKCYMKHGQRLTVNKNPIDQCMTQNYTPYMLRGLVVSWNQELEPYTSVVA